MKLIVSFLLQLLIACLCLVHGSLAAVTPKSSRKYSKENNGFNKSNASYKAPSPFHYDAQKVQSTSNSDKQTKALEEYVPSSQKLKHLRNVGPKRKRKNLYQRKDHRDDARYHGQEIYVPPAPQNIQGYLHEEQLVPRNQDSGPLELVRNYQSAQHIQQRSRPQHIQDYAQEVQQVQRPRRKDYTLPEPVRNYQSAQRSQKRNQPQQIQKYDQVQQGQHPRRKDYFIPEHVRYQPNTQYAPQKDVRLETKTQDAERRHFEGDHQFYDPFHYDRERHLDDTRRSRERFRNRNYDSTHRVLPRVRTYFQEHNEPNINVQRAAESANARGYEDRRDAAGYQNPQKGCKLVEKEISDRPEGLEGDAKSNGFTSKRYMMVKECFFQDEGPQLNEGRRTSEPGRGARRSESQSQAHTAQPYEYHFDKDNFFKDFFDDRHADFSHDHYSFQPYDN